MNSTKKHKKTRIDFNVVLQNNSLNRNTLEEKTKPSIKTVLISFVRKSVVWIFSGNKFSLFIKKLKRFFYKKFFWGRGIYYKFSIITSILFMVIPVSVLASNIKPDNSISMQNIAVNRVVDTAYDTGNGRNSLPNNKTIDAIQSYVVQSGDTPGEVANRFGISEETLLYTNNLNSSSTISVGQTLKILPISGILYKVKSGDTLDSIAKNYNIAQYGYSPQVMLEINLLDTVALKADQEILVPGAKPPATAVSKPAQSIYTQARVSFNPPPGVAFIPPVTVGNISTCYSAFHPAVDIASNSLPPIFASAGGKVIYAGWGRSGGSGIAVVIDHGNGYTTEYYHMSRVTTSVGDTVKQGDQIGVVGTTGRSTGPHVHFIIKYNGVEQNPFKLVDLSKFSREYTATTC